MSSTQTHHGKRPIVVRTLLVGAAGVGKTELNRAFNDTEGTTQFNPNYTTTVGMDLRTKTGRTPPIHHCATKHMMATLRDKTDTGSVGIITTGIATACFWCTTSRSDVLLLQFVGFLKNF